MKAFKKIVVVLALVVLVGCHKTPNDSGFQPDHAEIIGTISKVKDGDTVSVVSAGKRFDIRLYGIDAPEKVQPYGLKSKALLVNMVLNKRVRIELTGGATYGRIVGVVWVDDKNLNLYMVCQGLAWWAEEFAPKAIEMKTCQETAIQKALGLWSVPNPVPPWIFRKQKK